MRRVPFDVNDAGQRDEFLRQDLRDALAGLRQDTAPRWGKMTAQQMLEHLLWAFELSSGRAVADCSVPEAQQDRVRRFLHDNRPTPREFMNPLLTAGLPPLRHGTLAEAKAALLSETDRFLEQAEAVPGRLRMHPIFGPLAPEEWSRVHFKHGYHHFLQFGLIEEEKG
jgi:oxepin-CoA hydrolase/3-oxo-5,6-dehydrosuberyl-CoA semialdehyde dehydrogenase